jgi:hypothetical protein
MSQNLKEKTDKVFNQLRKDNLEILKDFYAKDLVFEDPLGRIEGLQAMKTYYALMYENVTEIKFDFFKSIQEGNEFFFRWTMTLNSTKLNGGNDISVEGGSMIFFNDEGLVTYHRDFFDMGEMIYEHIPLLKNLIKAVKKRFEH